VSAVRGRAVLVAAQLLKSKGAGQVVLPAPVAPREFDGPNGELLRLQDEILYLALETLRKGQP
jgi:predicted phosphoribosyltransferase